jgi:two-component system nitrogen regulation response regulator NtrX
LKVVALELPPLRERSEDIPALASRFLGQLAERLEREPMALSAAALASLTRHAWPGNVRELRNVLEQAAVLAAGEQIEVSDLRLGDAPVSDLALEAPSDVAFAEAKKQTIESFERTYLLRALRENDGNISRTAQAIGMVRQSLQQKIRELDLRSEDWARDSDSD